MPIRYKRELIPRAKELRKEATVEENRLWYEFLRNYPIRFQRQKSIDHFIADFYCCRAKLIVEIDGSQHHTSQGKAYDEERTAILQRYGLQVIRFSNRQINQSFWAVCNEIDFTVKKLMEQREHISFQAY